VDDGGFVSDVVASTGIRSGGDGGDGDALDDGDRPVGVLVSTEVEGGGEGGRRGAVGHRQTNTDLANALLANPPMPAPFDKLRANGPPLADGRPPIEIDLVKGTTVDLTNGLSGGGAAATPSTPTVDLTGNNDGDGGVEELFSGYEDNDYDPSEYDYVDDDEGPAVRSDQPGYTGGNAGGRAVNSLSFSTVDLRDEGDALDERGEEYSDDNRRGVDVNLRKGKAGDQDTFDEAYYYDDENAEGDPFVEYTELDSEPQTLDDADDDGDKDVRFISVPLKIEELAGEAENGGGDTTVILAGSPPAREEEEDIQPVTVRGIIPGLRSRGSGGSGNAVVVRKKKKRVQDIPHSAFHAFLTETPNAGANNQKKRGATSSSSSSSLSKAATRGISDWSQRLREKRRQQVWRQFRLQR